MVLTKRDHQRKFRNMSLEKFRSNLKKKNTFIKDVFCKKKNVNAYFILIHFTTVKNQ